MRRLAALAAALALGAGCASSRPELPPRRGHLAALQLPPVAEAPYAPAVGALEGRVVLVAFVATWCLPCIAQLPTLDSLQKELGPQGLRTVAVGMDLDGEQVLAPFAEYYALPYPLVVASEPLRTGESPYGRVTSLPTFFLLDRRGEPLGAWEGIAGQEQLERAVRKALKTQ
ncbi:TlpA family protein disulfide reductase [Aggregicoccus sp. 17bor-14]|uniref:TlpA family protein disulfide reductase n=1 Tax=Myxococcaceae TaxID=31 RepID=UPI00129CFFA4|nr:MULTISPECIES: TlpA disulfide reductase family protein [Myxococcaceae]MBF5040820.1 TlpA family protein disulfide reductase [Simulacricoccus sp. 17bor-14]MRI86609.1 TlpA family protein disulfide reductase [Aggregicoccus sp. 17bor-14]